MPATNRHHTHSPSDTNNPAEGDLTVVEIGPEGFALERFGEDGEWERLGVYPDFATVDEIVRIANVKNPGIGAPHGSASGPHGAVPLSTLDNGTGGILDKGVVVGENGQRHRVSLVNRPRPSSDLQALMEAPPGADPERSAEEDEERREAIDEALRSRLTDRRREVLEMTAAGMTSKEIAATLGVGHKTVEDALCKARRNLRPLLEPLVDRPARTSPSATPERYEPFRYGPPEPVCSFCTPTAGGRRPLRHSSECVAPGMKIEWRRLPMGLFGGEV